MSQSNRRSERVQTSLPVRWMKKSGAVELNAADINLHGMFLVTSDLSTLPGEMLQLQVTLPGGTLDMFVIARFVGRTQSGTGIGAEIFVMDEVQQEKWAEHYRSLTKKSARAAAA